MIYLIALIAGLVFVIGVGGKAYSLGGQICENKHAQAELKIKAKEEELQQAKDAQIVEANKTIESNVAAFEAGQAKGRVKYVKVQTQGGKDVATYPVFVNRSCNWPADVVRNVSSAFTDLYAAPDPGIPNPAVSGSTAPAGQGRTGNDAGTIVPVDPKPAGAVEPVPSATGQVGGGGQVPGHDLPAGAHPKPRPIGK